jgi:tyrosyl-tRNA synthetase
MTLSEELAWRGFVNQTTLKDPAVLDGHPLTFYWGVDPSAPSMTIGNLAAAMMVRLFMKHGHNAVLLVGGATGLIGDPDGKADERVLKTPEEVAANADAIAAQYRQILGEDRDFKLVNNYDWFKNMGYLQFLREAGKHVPLRQMVQREFVQSRIGEEGSGLSYAEFSYVLIQGYDFLHLYREHGVTLQLCGSDQWGNSIAGVDLIRRIAGGEAHVWSTPLVVNKATGKKFGKTEEGAIWLDPARTTPTAFYQFWMNVDDAGAEDYLKIFTELGRDEIARIMEAHRASPAARTAQKHLAREVTELVHGKDAMEFAEVVTGYLTGMTPIGEADPAALQEIRGQLPSIAIAADAYVTDALVQSGLAASLTEARRLLADNAIAVNGTKISREQFTAEDFLNGRAMLRKGKKYKDTALVELS